MTKELTEKLSNLSLLGYYDKDLMMLCVHFFGEGDKPDLMAYLRPDLSWDLREVLSEKVELFDDCERVCIKHTPLGMFKPGSKFDEFVRGMLTKSLEVDNYMDKGRIEEVLKNGYGT